MTREAHLQWAKTRALQFVAAGDLHQAVSSMVSDLRKHPETAWQIADGFLLVVGTMTASRDDVAGVRLWIEGFH